MKKRIAIFASGYGSNAFAIMQACREGLIDAEVVLVVSDVEHAHVQEYAKQFLVPGKVFIPAEYASKSLYETAILKWLQHQSVELIVLAGYMRLIGTVLLHAYEGRIVNIHPSLLPKYRGLNAIGQAIDNGEEEIGVTVHYVDAGMDTGKIIAQQKVEKNIKGMNQEEITRLVHEVEHQLYVNVLKKLLNDS